VPVAKEQVADVVEHHMAHRPADADIAPVATGKFNDTFDVRLPDRSVIVRIAPPESAVFCFYEFRMMRQEPGIHRMLRRRTSVPVAEILVADFTHAWIDRDFLIMEKLPGRPLTEVRVSREQHAAILRKTGEYLAECHAIHARQYGYLGEHEPMAACDTWPQAFEVIWGKLIDDAVSVDGYSPAEADFMTELLVAARPHFTADVPSCFCHMDIWHQNILVDASGEITGLVDWDRALWGDPEIEFAVLDYCGISEPAFWAGYGSPRAADESAQVRRILYLLCEMQKYIVIRKGRDGRPAEAAAHARQVLALARRLAG